MSEHEHLHPPKHGPPGHTPDEHDPDEHGGRVRERAAMLGKEPEELLDFSANVNFLGPTLPVVAAARRAIDEMAWYPQDPPTLLRRAVRAYSAKVGSTVRTLSGRREATTREISSEAPFPMSTPSSGTRRYAAAARRRRVGGSCGYQAISSMARRAAATTGRVGPKKFTLAEKSRSSSGSLPSIAARSRTRPPCSSGSCSSGVCPGGPCLGG